MIEQISQNKKKKRECKTDMKVIYASTTEEVEVYRCLSHTCDKTKITTTTCSAMFPLCDIKSKMQHRLTQSHVFALQINFSAFLIFQCLNSVPSNTQCSTTNMTGPLLIKQRRADSTDYHHNGNNKNFQIWKAICCQTPYP